MVSVSPISGLTYYMDDKLKKNLDSKVLKTINHKDEDYVIGIDGPERIGKSVFAMQLAKYVDPTFCLDRICFTADDFAKQIVNAKKGQAVILDEAYRSLGSRNSLSEVNKMLVGLMTEMGQKNLFVIVVLPTVYLLDRYVALWRIRGLFHCFKSRGIKGYWRYYNKKKIIRLYQDAKNKQFYIYPIKSKLRGRFYNQYTVNEKEYRARKDKFLKDTIKTTKSVLWLEQRNILIWILSKDYGLSGIKIETLLKANGLQLDTTQIKRIVADFKGRIRKTSAHAL